MSCWPGSRPAWPRPMPGWRWWPRRMSWRRGRWRPRSGTWPWPNGSQHRGRAAGGNTGGCCSGWSGCCWTASGGTCRPWPPARGTCRPWPRSRTRRSPAWARTCSALALISLGSTELLGDRVPRTPSATWTAASRWPAGAGGPTWSSPAWPTRRRTRPITRFARAAERGRQAVELAERHGWTDDPAAGMACTAVAAVLVWQGQPDAAEPWVQRAERTLTADTQPAAVLAIRLLRGTLELERDRNAAALAALEAGEALARRLAGPNYFAARIRALAGAVPDPPRPGRAGRAVPGRARRAGPRPRRDPRRRRGTAARPGRPAGRARRARPHPAGLRRRGLPGILAGPGGHAGGARQGRARRPRCR